MVGERAALAHLQGAGLRFLMANFRTRRGEIDLVFREGDCLVFVEVKTRSSEEWTRPAAAVNLAKQRKLSRAALDYLRALDHPQVPFRFDIIEVLLDGEEVRDLRHIPNAFGLASPYRYG